MFLKLQTVLFLISCLLNLLKLGIAANSLALDHCDDHCGKVSIPFPFGMSSGCYLDQAYKIDCLNRTRPVLSVGDSSLEVLNISVDQQRIRVKFPVTKICGTRQSSVISLEGSPYNFSNRNSFTGVGCNIAATLRVGGSPVGGCMSFCNHRSLSSNGSSCSLGRNCCQAGISGNLKVFNATVEDIDHREVVSKENCRYAYLVDSDSIGESDDYAPVALSWSLSDDLYSHILINRNHTVNQTVSCGYRYLAKENVECYCSYGFEGNPYKPDGCHDIDECANPKNNCYNYGGYCINLYGSYGCSISETKSKSISIGIGAGFGGLLLAVCLWILYIKLKKMRARKLRAKFFKRNGGIMLTEQMFSGETMVKNIRMFSPKELMKATDKYNVNRLLGKGGQGTVFKGMLEDGRIVAVKKSNAIKDSSKIRDFINEIVILSQINHRNVVKLLGCCLETEAPILVYEFISNGNLFQLLHPDDPSSEDPPLTWDMRMKIAKEVSGAISYLHSAASIPIFHRDIKSTNILLDDKLQAKVADFGASKSVQIDQTHVTTRVQGTFGYLDPEYFRSNQFTDKSDVYSFGVVLVELITGLKPVCTAEGEEIRGLAHYFLVSIEEDRLFETVDMILTREVGESQEIIEVANLAKRCLSWAGRDRPTMKEASMALEMIINSRTASSGTSSLFRRKFTNSVGKLSFNTTSTDQSGIDSTSYLSCS